MKQLFTLYFIILICSSGFSQNYNFKDTMSRELLETYLSRAITMQGLTDQISYYQQPSVSLDTISYKANIVMLSTINARFIGRACGLWGSEENINRGYFNNIDIMVKDINNAYQSKNLAKPIIQAGIFEYVSGNVDQVAFSKQVASVYKEPIRKFNYTKMGYDNFTEKSSHQTYWNSSYELVPDISKKETQMWFYFLATSYIDQGIEAIHFGNIDAMNKKDTSNSIYYDLLNKIRAYAKTKNRGIILCDAHTKGITYNNQLLFDFHSSPIRIKEIPRLKWKNYATGAASIDFNYCNAIYGKSTGGISPLGWSCDALPYLVEFDNYGVILSGINKTGAMCYPWGFDEISWFANQTEKYRNKWLIYAFYRVKKLDKNAFLQMPGMRGVYIDAKKTRLYQAQQNKDAQQKVIEDIWLGKYETSKVNIKSLK